IAPGTQGGANWPGGSYDPETHTIYIYSKSVLETLGAAPTPADPTQYATSIGGTRNTSENGGGGFGGSASINGAVGGGRGGGRVQVNDAMDAPIVPGLLTVAGLPIIKPPYGPITAIDLNQGGIAWQ